KATTTTAPETTTTKATTTTAPETTTTKATTTTAPETTTTKATTTTAPETTTKATTTTTPETTTTKATTTTASETTTTKATTTTAPETTTKATTTTTPETTTTKSTTTTAPETTTTKVTTTTATETTTTKATTTTASETTTTTPVTTTTEETTTTEATTTTIPETTTTEITTEKITEIIKENGLTYEVDMENKTAVLISCDDGIENIVIPSEIEGNTVVKIASTAFENNSDIKSVSIPETVEEVDEAVFDDLEEIDVYVIEGSKIQQFLDGNEIKYSLVKIEKYLMGDIDLDGSITSADALAVLQNVVEIKEFTEVESIAADVDGDGSITSADALAILQYVVGLEKDFNGAVSVNITASADDSSVISKEYYDESGNIVDIKAE
ncbi:MAG: dockerin type I domain-containing protein, partial [Oscillospiraceae bacterium]